MSPIWEGRRFPSIPLSPEEREAADLETKQARERQALEVDRALAQQALEAISKRTGQPVHFAPTQLSTLRRSEEREEVAAEGARLALHAAARRGDLSECERLLPDCFLPPPDGLERWPNVNDADSEGHTALHWAADGGHTPVVVALLEHSADLNARNRDGSTPLHMACAHSKPEVAVLLCDRGADCMAADHDGASPLGLADPSLVAWLSRSGHVV